MSFNLIISNIQKTEISKIKKSCAISNWHDTLLDLSYFRKKCKIFLINFPSNTNQKYSVLRNNKILRDRWENARYIQIIRFYPEYSTVAIYNERTSRWQGTLGRKGSRISPSHLDILVSRRVAGTLKGRQVKVPHRRARKSVFFSSAPCLSLPLSVRSPLFPETGRRSFSRARLLFSGRTIGNMWHEG